MSKTQIWPMLAFVFGLLVASVGGTAYLHASFATKEETREMKTDIKEHLFRIEDKVDHLIERR